MLAQRLNAVFDDADDYHLPQNRAKLAAGEALTDEERKPWYALLRRRIEEVRSQERRHVLACSALTAALRAWLCGDDPPGSVIFILLEGAPETIDARMRARSHFMPPSLLGSQFAKLEVTQNLLRVSNETEPEAALENMLTLLDPMLVQYSTPS
jgi:carbohydrate kinase (thermoresistant glucokinase family)